MPIISGTEALKKILEWDGNAKKIMVTGERQRDTEAEAVSAGAKGYIAKPPAKAKVCAAVMKALNS